MAEARVPLGPFADEPRKAMMMSTPLSQRRQFLLDDEIQELAKILSPESFSAVQEIIKRHWDDLAGNVRGTFSPKDLLLISGAAGGRLKHALTMEPYVSASRVRAIWHEIVVDFHTGDYWGFKKGASRSDFTGLTAELKQLERYEDRKKEKKRPEVDVKEMRRYILLFIQVAILAKVVILYFGLKGCASL